MRRLSLRFLPSSDPSRIDLNSCRLKRLSDAPLPRHGCCVLTGTLGIRLLGGQDTETHTDTRVKDLIEAAASGQPSSVKTLLEHGADPNARNADGWFPLLAAVLGGSREVVEMLTAAGGDVNAQAPDGSTALMKATLWRQVDIVRLLLSRGANVHVADERGWTALGIAMLIEHPELVTLLRRYAR